MLKPLESIFNIFICSSHKEISETISHALEPLGCSVRAFSDGDRALLAIRETPQALIIVTPALNGIEGIQLVRRIKQDSNIYSTHVILAISDLKDAKAGFDAGADDILAPGFTPVMVRMKVKSTLDLLTMLNRQGNELKLLEMKVRQRTTELEELTLAMVAALERASELNDRETGNHILRVGRYSEIIAESMGVGQDLLTKIRLYAPLHDVGKVAISDTILKKTAPLSPEEFETMKKHTLYGYELLSMAKADEVAKNIALSHHERWDGTGYPFGLSGQSIPLEARIVSLADVFDAITTQRPYKRAMGFDAAIRYIEVDAVRLFDPDTVAALIKSHKDMKEVFDTLNSRSASFAL